MPKPRLNTNPLENKDLRPGDQFLFDKDNPLKRTCTPSGDTKRLLTDAAVAVLADEATVAEQAAFQAQAGTEGNADPEFYDRFARAGTADNVVTDPPVGNPYTIRYPSGGDGDLHIEEYDVAADQGTKKYRLEGPAKTWYLGQNLGHDNFQNMGAKASIAQGATETDFSEPVLVFLIYKKDDTWLNNNVHIRFTPYNVGVEFFINGSDEGNSVGTFYYPDAAFLVRGRHITHNFEVEITGDRCRVTVNGAVIADVEDSRFSQYSGGNCYWESSHDASNAKGNWTLEEIWVNRPQANLSTRTSTQGKSDILDAMSFGVVRTPTIHIANSSREEMDGTLDAGRVVVDGGGTQFSKFITTSSAAAASDEDLIAKGGYALRFIEYILDADGDRIDFEVLGSYAANANTKRIKWDVHLLDGAGIFDSGDRAGAQGSWMLKGRLVLSAVDTITARYEYIDSLGTLFTTGSASRGESNNTPIRLFATGTDAGDVVLNSVIQDWQPGHRTRLEYV